MTATGSQLVKDSHRYRPTNSFFNPISQSLPTSPHTQSRYLWKHTTTELR